MTCQPRVPPVRDETRRDEAFCVNPSAVQDVLAAYGVLSPVIRLSELRRYRYQQSDPASREIRLILRVQTADGTDLVLKFLNEQAHPQMQVEAQSAFSEHLCACGMPVSPRRRAGGAYTACFSLSGFSVYTTLEDFMENELAVMDESRIVMLGSALAAMHSIAERDGCHLPGDTLFDPFSENDLFSFSAFDALCRTLPAAEKPLVREISARYRRRTAQLSPLRARARYAVQGDLSNNNLYFTADGRIGFFDFNNCADAVLLSDAVMEGMLAARLSDFEAPVDAAAAEHLFLRFLAGYAAIRPFSAEDRRLIAALYALCDAFWRFDIEYADSSLRAEIAAMECHAPMAAERVHAHLLAISAHLQRKLRI